VKAQESNGSFGNPSLPNWLNVMVSDFTEIVVVDNGDGFVWEFSKSKDKFNQVYENGTLIVKDEQWLLIGEDLKEDSHPIGKLEWEQPEPYHVVVTDFYEDLKNNNNFTVVYSFYGGFHPKITFNVSIGVAQNYTVNWRCWLYKDNALHETEKHWVKFWNENETGVVFNYEDVYQSFGNITESDVTGWFKGKRFDQNFNVGFLNNSFMLDPSFGYEGIGGSSGVLDDYIFGAVFTITEEGTADSITVALKYSTTQSTWSVKCAIYKHSDLSLVGSTEEREITPTLEFVWYTFNFDAPKPSLTTDTAYILVAWTEVIAGNCKIAYTTGDTDQLHIKNVVYTGTFPNPWESPTELDYKASIFCNYTTAGAQEYTEEFTETISPSASLYFWKALFEKYEETITVTATSYTWKEKACFYTETTTITEQVSKWIELKRFFTETITLTETANFAMEILLEITEFTETITVDAFLFLWKAKQFITQETISPIANLYDWISLTRMFIETFTTSESQQFLIEKLLSVTESVGVSTSLTVLKEILVSIIEFTEAINISVPVSFILPELAPSAIINYAFVLAAFAVVMVFILFGILMTKKDEEPYELE